MDLEILIGLLFQIQMDSNYGVHSYLVVYCQGTIQKIHSNNIKNRINTKWKHTAMTDINNTIQKNPVVFFWLHSIYHSGFGC